MGFMFSGQNYLEGQKFFIKDDETAVEVGKNQKRTLPVKKKHPSRFMSGQGAKGMHRWKKKRGGGELETTPTLPPPLLIIELHG